MPRPIRTLSEQEFNQTVAQMRLSQENIAIVKKILVQGVPLTLVAKEIKTKSKQSIEKATKRVWDNFLKKQNIPKDWVSFRVCLPWPEAMQVKVKEQELRQQLIKDKIFN